MLPPQQVLALAEAMNLSEMDRAVLIDGLLESLDSPKGIESIAEWYAHRRTSLGRRFPAKAHRILVEVQRRPRSFAQLPDSPLELEIRRVLMKTFPYAVDGATALAALQLRRFCCAFGKR